MPIQDRPYPRAAIEKCLVTAYNRGLDSQAKVENWRISDLANQIEYYWNTPPETTAQEESAGDNT